MKRMIILVALVIFMLISVGGCTNTDNLKKDERVHIQFYVWDKSMEKSLTPWLQEKFPEYDIEVVQGYNNMDYYTYLNEHGEMPDIITCRRFSINDAAHMSHLLMDLSETEVVRTFYSSYIENNREADGAIRWLPACAEVDGILANKDLFDKYGIEIPTNYAEFKEVCRKFKEAGVTPFITDFGADYTNLEIMQGSAVSDLMSMQGTSWRMEYESESDENPVGLDDKVWPVVFEKFDQFIKDTYVTEDFTEYSFDNCSRPFNEGTVPMIRATANDAVYSRNNYGHNVYMLPYFGEESEDNWVLTYPMFQIAVSKKIEEDLAKKEAVFNILNAIFTPEGQEKTSNNTAVLSYNKNVNFEFDNCFKYIEDCINRNHMYMRLASTEIFAISKTVGDAVIKDGATPKEAYDLFNNLLLKNNGADESEVLLTQTTSYPLTLGEHGSPACSSVVNTLRDAYDHDIVIGFANIASSDVFAADYTYQKIKWLLSFKAYTNTAVLTGAEIREVMETLINTDEEGNNPIRHYNLIPATSGMEYTMKDNGDGTYTLLDLSINGEALDDNQEYNVLLLGEFDFIETDIYCGRKFNEELKSKFKNTEARYFDYFIDGSVKLGQFSAPNDYVTIIK